MIVPVTLSYLKGHYNTIESFYISMLVEKFSLNNQHGVRNWEIVSIEDIDLFCNCYNIKGTKLPHIY